MNHTQEEWTQGLFPHLNHPHIVIMTRNGKEICTIHLDNNEVRANVKLIVDAGNTANKCELLPSELLEQRDELLEACESAIKAFKELGLNENQSCYKLALKAIKNATE